MVDNVDFTPGVGATAATDEIGGLHYQRVKVSIGVDGSATDWPSNAGAAGATVPRVVSANITTKGADASFTRPANTTAYTANDAVANNTTAGSVTPLSWSIASAAGNFIRFRVRKSDQTVATPTIRIWLFDASPTPGAGDNAAFAFPAADSIGYVDVDVTNAGSDDAVGYETCDIPFAASTIYGLLQTLTTFTPASAETITVTPWYVQG